MPLRRLPQLPLPRRTRNRFSRIVFVGVVLAFVAVLVRMLANPDARWGIVWAARSWFVPPDAAAGWEQGRG